MKLLLKALTKFTLGIIIVGMLIFIPAGTLEYINGWIFIGVLFIPVFILGLILFLKSPDMLEKRLNAKESENTQKGVVLASALLFIIGFIVAGLDFRFEFSHVPMWAVIAASIVLLVSYILYAEVMRENAYLSRTIKVEENQKVVSTGLYGIVRHPMYAVTIWLFLAIPIILGSLFSLICFVPYIGIIAVRIVNEEKVLEQGLIGYSEYKKKVKYRLIPFIW